MNHYEELGVSPSATTAEIRQAYKSLVRLLHPDQQQDENLRRLSELQLRRLNHLFQVLSNPEQRRAYDLSLHPYLPAVRHKLASNDLRQEVPWSGISRVRLRLRIQPGVAVWMLIGAIALGSAIFWIRSPEPDELSPPVREHLRSSAPARATPETGKAMRVASRAPARTTPAANIAEQKSPVPLAASAPGPRLIVEPKLEPRKPERTTRPSLEPSSSAGQAIAEAAAPPMIVPVPPKNTDPSPAPTVPKAQSVSVSGKWLYVPRPDDGKAGLYPPEYIEVRINNRAGILRGKYHGKYRVSDRAISSEINFQFEGRQGETVSILPWAATNGSKGEMRLKRLSDESIEVNWITTTFGQSNTLASGTAVLYRSDPP